MQVKARQSLRMQLKYNVIIQFKFQALRRFFRYHGCMLNGIVPLNRNVHRTHFLSSNFRHSASLALSQSATTRIRFYYNNREDLQLKKAAAYCTFFELAV